jgi:hypothetical protein
MGDIIISDLTKRLKPWFHLTVEEKSHLIYQAYRHNVLVSDELKTYLRKIRYNNFSNFIFPLAVYPLTYLFLTKVYLFYKEIFLVLFQTSKEYDWNSGNGNWGCLVGLDQLKSLISRVI